MEGEKKLSEITRKEWIMFNWFDTTQVGDQERMMARGMRRTPEEAFSAKMQWDETAEDFADEKENIPTEFGKERMVE